MFTSPCNVIFLHCSVKDVSDIFLLPVFDVQACRVLLIDQQGGLPLTTSQNNKKS